MSDLTSRERELVAIGAAIASNCVPCIRYHVPVARRAGLTAAQVQEAVKIADDVRAVPAREVYEEATRLVSTTTDEEQERPCCGPGAAEGLGQNKCC